jgi:hypothetical protein
VRFQVPPGEIQLDDVLPLLLFCLELADDRLVGLVVFFGDLLTVVSVERIAVLVDLDGDLYAPFDDVGLKRGVLSPPRQRTFRSPATHLRNGTPRRSRKATSAGNSMSWRRLRMAETENQVLKMRT